MARLFHNITIKLIASICLVFSLSSYASDPMDDVFSLLGSSGTRSGANSVDGYYVVAVGRSTRSSEAKALEESRLDALTQLNEMINGVELSGFSEASMKYVTVSDGVSTKEFSEEYFLDVVSQKFKGNLSAVKQIKSGKYKNSYFTALMIAESDIANVSKLKTSSKAATASSIAADEQDMASFSSEVNSVEAKGLASMKDGESAARKLAIQDAIRNAVQQAQGVMLSGKSGRFNDAVSLAISTKTEGYVSSYEILDEDIERGQYYVIMMAEVNGGQLLNDARFYLDIFGNAKFSVQSENYRKTDWLTSELEKLGFSLTKNQSAATHTFKLKQDQYKVQDHKGATGVETHVSVQLIDNHNRSIILTVANEPQKTRIYVEPISRSQQVSEHQAYKQLSSQLGLEVIQALATHAERGVVYPIVIKNANRNDVAIFKHVLENSTNGTVENWQWNKQNKTMTLNFRFSGTLSSAFDQGLDELYSTFKTEGKGRRPHLKSMDDRNANFEIR